MKRNNKGKKGTSQSCLTAPALALGKLSYQFFFSIADHERWLHHAPGSVAACGLQVPRRDSGNACFLQGVADVRRVGGNAASRNDAFFHVNYGAALHRWRVWS